MEVLQMPNKQFPCIGVEHWKISLSVYWDLLNLQRDHNGVWKGRTFAYNHSRLLYSCKHLSSTKVEDKTLIASVRMTILMISGCSITEKTHCPEWNPLRSALLTLGSSAECVTMQCLKDTVPKYLTSFPLMWWHCQSGTIVFVLIARTNAK
jgi:hypothetical protein